MTQIFRFTEEVVPVAERVTGDGDESAFPRTVAADSPRTVLIGELLLHGRFDDGIPHTHFWRWSAIMTCWSTPKAEIASVSHRLMSYWAISVELHTGHDSAPGSTFEPH